MRLITLDDIIDRGIWEDFTSSFSHFMSEEIYYSDLAEEYDVTGKEFSALSEEDVIKYYEFLNAKFKNNTIRLSTVERKFKEMSALSSYIESNCKRYGLTGYENHFKKFTRILKNRKDDENGIYPYEADMILDKYKDDLLNYNVIYFGYYGRLNSSEIISLRITDVCYNRDSNSIKIPDKAPFKASSYTDEYWKTRSTSPLQDYYFLNSRNNPLNYMYLSRIIRKGCASAGVREINFNRLSQDFI